MTRNCWMHAAAVALTAVLTAGMSNAWAGVHVALIPSSAQVAPGAEFDVRVRVTEQGDAFNAYSAVVSFDPAALTFIPMPPATQEGAYMALACGSSSHSCTPGTGQVTLSHTLLCLGLSLTGPGDLYVLRFRASNTPQTTSLHFASVQFYYAGHLAAISEAVEGSVQIGSPSDAGAPAGAGTTALRAAPNPFSARTVLYAAVSGSRPSAAVFDARGRLVRSLTRVPVEAGRAIVEWNGLDDAGARVQGGVYWIVVTSGRRHASTRVVRLD